MHPFVHLQFVFGRQSNFATSCLIVPAKPLVAGGKKCPLDKGEFFISDLVGTALCLESGIWKKKEDLEVN